VRLGEGSGDHPPSTPQVRPDPPSLVGPQKADPPSTPPPELIEFHSEGMSHELGDLRSPCLMRRFSEPTAKRANS
jgi:hypothetical protein